MSSKRVKKASICRDRSDSGCVTRRKCLRAANAASTQWSQASTSTIEPEQLQQASFSGISCKKLIFYNNTKYTGAIKGSRINILSMGHLSNSIKALTTHSASCGGWCAVEGESRYGLATVLHIRCIACNHTFTMQLCEKIIEDNGRKWAINVGAVWGQLALGGGSA